MFQIIPSPGTNVKDWPSIENRIELVKPFAKTIHIDVVDGKFADNITFADPDPFKKYTSEIFFEVHLMVDNPIEYIQAWAKAGFRRFIGQIERMPDQSAFIAQAEEVGEAGLAIDGPTPLERLMVSPLDLDETLVMMIKAGNSGQQFQAEQLEKIKSIAQDALMPIGVDGGINEETIVKAYQAGARRFTVTSAIYDKPDPAAAYQNLHSICTNLEMGL